MDNNITSPPTTMNDKEIIEELEYDILYREYRYNYFRNKQNKMHSLEKKPSNELQITKHVSNE